MEIAISTKNIPCAYKKYKGKRGGVVGNGKGTPAGMTSMDEILSFQQQVKYLLYKISRNGAHPVPLDAVSDYKEAEAVPPEKTGEAFAGPAGRGAGAGDHGGRGLFWHGVADQQDHHL